MKCENETTEQDTDFKKASWMAREILKRVGFKIER